MEVNVHLLVCFVLVHTVKPALVKTLDSSFKRPTHFNMKRTRSILGYHSSSRGLDNINTVHVFLKFLQMWKL